MSEGAQTSEALFVTPDGLQDAAAAVAGALARAAARHPGPYSGAEPATLREAVEALDPLPEEGVGFERALAEIEEHVLAHGVDAGHPLAAGHLHAPPLLAAAAAELAIGATNQSMDSFDQAPAATYVEDRLVRRLAALLGLPAGASGVMTAGGTASNLLGLLLARDHAARRIGVDLMRDGLPDEARTWRIAASANAHFSVRRAAGLLGLGGDAVIPVATDRRGRMDPAGLDRIDGELIAIVGTAGTTDLGAIDPLEELAGRGAWLHVDAAVGAGLAISDRLRPRFAGIERADSVTADLHKLLWQPIGASALLVRDARLLHVVHQHSDYLNRPEDEAVGVLNLVGRSLDTSRRFDALKALLSFRSVGRARLAELAEHLVATTELAARRIGEHQDLELVAEPSTITVVFRVAGGDEVNTEVQRRLFASGRALIGRTRHEGAVALKLTLTNPRITPADIETLLRAVTGEAAMLRKR